ncbi:hypothetical protein KIN20_011863 [Parelaphostrongylus tenuis]|uniref:Uncharacterized protein n=1 Tax=Parelaphostrongylus tenuis TaxID=148309 RepID=A0AAD5MW20_PARTN|nr:hypothetical protein KIN20_011863 [Parelaphostrongylus tenuis]
MYPDRKVEDDIHKKHLSEPGLKYTDGWPQPPTSGHFEFIARGWNMRAVQVMPQEQATEKKKMWNIQNQRRCTLA